MCVQVLGSSLLVHCSPLSSGEVVVPAPEVAAVVPPSDASISNPGDVTPDTSDKADNEKLFPFLPPFLPASITALFPSPPAPPPPRKKYYSDIIENYKLEKQR